MPDPLATIVRFDGDSDDLLHRFEEARRTAHLKSSGLHRPTNVERLTIAKLGWTEATATPT